MGFAGALDLADVVALRVPKPLLVLQRGLDGLFPLAAMAERVANLGAIYKKAGAAPAFTAKLFEEKHIFNIAMQEEAFGWLDGVLKG